jgi:hypothetical protein
MTKVFGRISFFVNAGVRFPGIAQIESFAEFEGGHEAVFGRWGCRPDKLKKFSFTPRYDQAPLADLEFQLTIVAPSEELVQFLAANVADEIALKIEPNNAEFDFAGEDAA